MAPPRVAERRPAGLEAPLERSLRERERLRARGEGRRAPVEGGAQPAREVILAARERALSFEPRKEGIGVVDPEPPRR
jgi:hypothetical protein